MYPCREIAESVNAHCKKYSEEVNYEMRKGTFPFRIHTETANVSDTSFLLGTK